MAEFRVSVEASVSAKNLSSAAKKAAVLKDWLARKGWEFTEVRVKGSK